MKVICVFVDLQRAFETIDRSRLLEKLSKYGVNGVERRWFESYLRKRKQKTKFGNVLSEGIFCDLGVPQGTALAVILFILYINDIRDIFSVCKIKLFADDTIIYVSGENVDELIRVLNEELHKFYSWLCVNKLKLNESKTKYMIVSYRNTQETELVKINNTVIKKS